MGNACQQFLAAKQVSSTRRATHDCIVLKPQPLCKTSHPYLYLSSAHAAKLDSLLNRALDMLEMRYRSCGPSAAEIILTLSPIDDILVFLALAATTDGRLFVRRGY
jgi:hypothetical protein